MNSQHKAPQHPERNCWGCERFCPFDQMMCGNGKERTQHPVELFGADWLEGEPGSAGPGAARLAAGSTETDRASR